MIMILSTWPIGPFVPTSLGLSFVRKCHPQIFEVERKFEKNHVSQFGNETKEN